MNLSNASVQVDDVNEGTGGTHQLTIRFATGDTVAKKALYVNNLKVSDIQFNNIGG